MKKIDGRSVLPLQTILQFDFTHFSLISFIDKICWIFNNFSSGISSKFISKNFCSFEKRLEPAPFCRSTQFCSSIFPNSVLLKKNCWIWTIVRVASNPISMQDFFFVKIGAPCFAALFDLKRRNCNFIITVAIVLQLNSLGPFILHFFDTLNCLCLERQILYISLNT